MNITKEALQVEIDETEKDLKAFAHAREIVRARFLEVNDYPVPRLLPPMTQWSGTDAVLGALDLVVHAMERQVAELKAQHENAPSQPRLSIVRPE